MRRNFPLFCHCVNEVFALLGCYVVYVGSCITASCKIRRELVSQYATTNIYCTTQKRKDHINSIISVGWSKHEGCNGENT